MKHRTQSEKWRITGAIEKCERRMLRGKPLPKGRTETWEEQANRLRAALSGGAQ